MEEKDKVPEEWNFELSSRVGTYFSLLRKREDLEKQLAEVNLKIQEMKKKDKHLMTVVGTIDKLEKKENERLGIEEEKESKKPPAKRPRLGSPAVTQKGSSRARLTSKLKEGPPPVDKSLQENARK